MGWRKLWLFVIIVVALGGYARAAPLSIYGELPSIEFAAMSPDGNHVALVKSDGFRHLLEITNQADQNKTKVMNLGTTKLRGIMWGGERHLIALYSITGKIPDTTSSTGEWLMGEDFNLKKNTVRPLLWTGQGLNILRDVPHIRIFHDEPYALVEGVAWVGNQGRTSLYRVDMERGVTDIVMAAAEEVDQIVVDETGNTVATAGYSRGDWTLWINRGRGLTEQDRVVSDIVGPEVLGLGRTTNTIAVFFPGQKSEVREYPIFGGATSTLEVTSSSRLFTDPTSELILARSTVAADHVDWDWFAATDEAAWTALTAKFRGARLDPVSVSADHTKWIVKVDSPTDGPAYLIFIPATGEVHDLGKAYDGLRPEDISPVRPIAFKAKDGLPLTGYLTLPRNVSAKGLPLIVFPHGGPASRDEPGFDWWVQAMASRGYAVLQVNFRGSNELGAEFMSAGFGQWGRKMQTDLSDGVSWLAEQGVIDRSRVCIVGASYGGYAALAGVTLQSGIYRCAVSVAGPSDLSVFVGNPGAWGPSDTQRYWDRYMGDPKGFRDLSPALRVTAETAPILLIHGRDDTVVPYRQSVIMASALKKAGRPVAFVTLNSEDHWLSRGETRLQMLKATIDFLETNNPPGAAGASGEGGLRPGGQGGL